MNFIEFIQHLQNKPERERKIIVIAASFALTFLISAAWVLSLSRNLSPLGAETGSNKSEQNASLLSPFQSLKKDFSDLKSKSAAAFSGLLEAAKNSSDGEDSAIEIKNEEPEISKPLKLPVEQ